MSIIGNEREKGSVDAMNQLENFMKMPKHEREKMAEKAKAAEAKEEKRQAKRREQGKPDAKFELTGQERCCWSCGNVEQAGRQLCECRRCKGFLCPAPSCCSQHTGFCFSIAEPEGEAEIANGGIVECVVLPVDQRIKPYVRPLPKPKRGAEQALQQILR